jgi:hypothetical protein
LSQSVNADHQVGPEGLLVRSLKKRVVHKMILTIAIRIVDPSNIAILNEFPGKVMPPTTPSWKTGSIGTIGFDPGCKIGGIFICRNLGGILR